MSRFRPMPPSRPRAMLRSLMLLGLMLAPLTLVALAACSDSVTGVDLPPELIGTWHATEFVLSHPDTQETQDLIADGSSFTLTIEANGRYRAEGLGAPQAEVGTVRVDGSEITLNPDGEPAGVGTWCIDGGVLIVDTETTAGSRTYDLHMELEKE